MFTRLVLIERDGFRIEPPEMPPSLECKKNMTSEVKRIGINQTYRGLLVGVMYHPALFEYVGSAPFCVLDRLHDAHKRDVVAHRRADSFKDRNRHLKICINSVARDARVT